MVVLSVKVTRWVLIVVDCFGWKSKGCHPRAVKPIVKADVERCRFNWKRDIGLVVLRMGGIVGGLYRG